MSHQESIDIFNSVWNADIINKTEPLYSVAMAIAEYWSRHAGDGATCRTPFNEILVERLRLKWKREIVDEIIMNINRNPLKSAPEEIGHLQIRYKDSRVILEILNTISNMDLFLINTR